MKQIFIISCVFFVFLTAANAGEFYNCIDRDGNTVITDSPQSGMNKCVLKAIDEEPMPQEQRKLQRSNGVRRQQEYRNNILAEPKERAMIDDACKRECSVDLSSCEFHCSGSDYTKHLCKDSCRKIYDHCVDRCWR